MQASDGRGAELAEAMAARCLEVQKEDAGCVQYEVFRSAVNPDSLVLLEHWTDQAALDAHSEANRARPPMAGAGLRAEGVATIREDYEYNRTR
jgi:quinol monooxygenase YgiN